jgi:hypothetical protein
LASLPFPPTVPFVIGFVRFVGLMNAAVWFGAAFFFTFGADPASRSSAMRDLLQQNFPYFSVAIGEVISWRYFHLFEACSVVALLHLVAEWLYFGKYPQRLWLALVFGLCLGGLFQLYLIQPRLKEFHRLQFGRLEQREAAARHFGAWRRVSWTVNMLLVGGLGIYLWRVANPANPTRILNAAKFRS